jgi:hypothetical protein
MNGLGMTGNGTPGSIIKLYDSNGVLVAEVEVDSNGNWSIPVSMLPGGTTVGFSGSFTVTDIYGNVSDPTIITSIDSIPPSDPITTAATGAGLYGTAEPGSTVYLLDANGNIITSVIVDSTGHWFIPVASFPGGIISPFTGSIKVVDPAGNESAIVNLNLGSSIDLSAPIQPLTTTQNATGLSGVAEPGSTINLLDSNGNIVASVVVDNTGQWTLPASSFPNGTSNGFNGSIVSVDAAGNISPPTIIHTIDGLAPNPPVITIANASGLFGTAEANSFVKMFDSSTTLISSTITDVIGNWVFAPDKFPGGVTNGFVGTLTSTDMVGNQSSATTIPTIDGQTPAAPVITIANATGIFGTAEPNAVIRMYNSLGILVNGTTSDNAGNWSIPNIRFPGNVTNGFSGYLTQTDIAGNTSTQATINPVDGLAPNQPVVLIANYYGISGTAESGSRISLKDNTGTEVAFTFTDLNGNWSIPASSFPGQATDGFIGSLTATDQVGNVSVTSTLPEINGTLPITALTNYTDNVGTITSINSTAATTDDTTPGINIGPGIVDTPLLYIGGTLTAATYDSVAGTLTPTVALSNGTYDFTYTLTDTAGNISLPSATLTITVDTVAPTTPSAPSSYDDNVGSITNSTSTALTTDDTTPGINIGTPLTDTPKLYIDNVVVASTYNASTGTITPNTALTDGVYNFSYTLTDAVGNESGRSPDLAITIDLTSPNTPTNAPASYVDNVGPITSNTSVAPITDDTTPGIKVGFGLSNTPKLYVNGSVVSATYSAVAGTLTPNSALSEGVNVITYTLTDAAGNESGQSPAITITIDITAPSTETIASYVDNVGIIQSNSSIAASTDDTTPGINVGIALTDTPKLYIGGILTAATYNAIIGSLTPNVALTQGTYSFTYTLTDAIGNESLPSASFSITIDTTAPTTPGSAPASYDDNVGSITNTASTAIITDDTTPGINVGTGLTDTVKLYINDSLVVSNYDSVAGTLTPFYTLAEGTYAFSYTLSDSIGNESGQSPAISITIDITPPTAPLNKPSSYVDNVGSIQSTTSNSVVTDDTTPGINIGPGLTNTPKLYVNGVYTAATYVSGTGIITPNSPLTDGLKTITYTLSDVAGNESAQSPAITFTVDTVAPTTTTPTTFLDNVGPYQFTNSVLSITDDNRPGINIGTDLTDIVKLYVDTVLTPASYDSSLGTLTPTLPVSDGTRTFAYTLTDTAGNESTQSGTLTLVIDTIPPTTPVTAPASYADNVGYIQSATSTASTTNDTTPGINIGSGLSDVPTLYVNGVLAESTYDSVAGTLTPNTELSEGTYNFTYSIRDIAGNESGQSPALSITIDTTPPTTPAIAPYSYVDGNGNNSTASVTGAIAAVKVNNYVAAAYYRLYDNDVFVDSTASTDPNDSSKKILTAATAIVVGGSHTLKYTILDSAGNESGKSPGLNVTIDNLAEVTAVTLSWGSALNAATLWANGTVTATTNSVENGQTVSATVRRHWNFNNTYRYPDDWPAITSTHTGTVSGNSAVVTIPAADMENINVVGSDYSQYVYAVFCEVYDSYSNWGFKSQGFSVNFTPVISGITTSWGSELNATERSAGGTITVSNSNAVPGATVTVYLLSIETGPADVTATGSVTSTAGNTVVTFSSSALSLLTVNVFYDVWASVASGGNLSTMYKQRMVFTNLA